MLLYLISILLTDSNYSKIVGNNEYDSVYMYFFSPWCSNCKEFNSVWEIFVNNHKMDNISAFSEINGYENPELCRKYDINDFPNILFYNNKNGSSSILNNFGSIERLELKYRSLSFSKYTFLDSSMEIWEHVSNSSMFTIFYLQYSTQNTSLFFLLYGIIRNLDLPQTKFCIYRGRSTSFSTIYPNNTQIEYDGNWSADSLKMFISDHLTSNPVLLVSQNIKSSYLLIVLSERDTIPTIYSSYPSYYVHWGANNSFIKKFKLQHSGFHYIVVDPANSKYAVFNNSIPIRDWLESNKSWSNISSPILLYVIMLAAAFLAYLFIK